MGKKKIYTKKNKKLLPVILILFFVIILDLFIILSSTNKAKIKKEFYNIVDTMNNLANYSVTTNVNVDNLSNDRDKSFNSVYQQDFDIENNVYHVKFNDYNYEEEIYSIRDEEEKSVKSYQSNQEGEWFLSDIDINYIKNNDFIKVLYSSKNIKKVDSDIKKLTKYEVSIDTKKIMRVDLLKRINNLYNIDNKDLPKTLNINIYVNSKNYIEKIYINLFNESRNFTLNNKNYLFDKFEIIMNISNYNNLELIIPEEILNGAKLPDNNELINDDTLDISSYNEKQIMYDIILAASIYCKDTTINFANYNGELNKYLNLNHYDINSIKSGIISIDNKCRVKVKESFSINNKTCTYDIENAESCK